MDSLKMQERTGQKGDGMINFTVVFRGYKKEEVEKYFSAVEKKYEELYDEYIQMREAYQKQIKDREAVAAAIIQAEVKATEIIDNAKLDAWRIVSDAKLGALDVSNSLKAGPSKIQPLLRSKADEPPPDSAEQVKAEIEREIDDILKSLGKRL